MTQLTYLFCRRLNFVYSDANQYQKIHKKELNSWLTGTRTILILLYVYGFTQNLTLQNMQINVSTCQDLSLYVKKATTFCITKVYMQFLRSSFPFCLLIFLYFHYIQCMFMDCCSLNRTNIVLLKCGWQQET